MEQAAHGAHTSTHEALPVDSHGVPCGPLASTRDSRAALPRHLALLAAGRSTWIPVSFPMGSWGVPYGAPGRPPTADFLNQKTDLVNLENDLLNHEKRFTKPGRNLVNRRKLV